MAMCSPLYEIVPLPSRDTVFPRARLVTLLLDLRGAFFLGAPSSHFRSATNFWSVY